MSTPKKSKPANDTTSSPAFLSTAWDSLWGLADDTRTEAHKQVGGIISLIDSAAQGATSYATKLNDRVDNLLREGALAANRSGRSLVAGSGKLSQNLFASYRSSAAQLATSTRDSARSVAERASATARVIVAPVKSDKKAA